MLYDTFNVILVQGPHIVSGRESTTPRAAAGNEILRINLLDGKVKNKKCNYSTRAAVSAGGIVYRIENDMFQIVICGRFNPNTYNLPKGTPEKSETISETAVREVSEETGLDVRIERFVGVVTYTFMDNHEKCTGYINKKVVYFLMRPTGGSFSYHDEEFDTVEWVTELDLESKLTYGNEVSIVQKGLSMVKR